MTRTTSEGGETFNQITTSITKEARDRRLRILTHGKKIFHEGDDEGGENDPQITTSIKTKRVPATKKK